MNLKNINNMPDWHDLTGDLPYHMTNDYLFRATLQQNENTRIAFIAALLGWDKSSIQSATIENPIMLGETLKEKYFILDILVKVNNELSLNLEMQVINERNWPERSLLYLCRVYDSLNVGDSYTELKPAHHIGILNYTLFPDHPEFYATYQMLNKKDFHKYTDKFTLSVLSLSCIENATDEDKVVRLDLWAKMYNSKSWEELKMLAQQNPDIEMTISTMYELLQDRQIREQIQAREDFYRSQKSIEIYMDRQQKEIAEQQRKLDENQKKLDESQKELDEKQKEIDEQARYIAELEKKLAEAKKAD